MIWYKFIDNKIDLFDISNMIVGVEFFTWQFDPDTDKVVVKDVSGKLVLGDEDFREWKREFRGVYPQNVCDDFLGYNPGIGSAGILTIKKDEEMFNFNFEYVSDFELESLGEGDMYVAIEIDGNIAIHYVDDKNPDLLMLGFYGLSLI